MENSSAYSACDSDQVLVWSFYSSDNDFFIFFFDDDDDNNKDDDADDDKDDDDDDDDEDAWKDALQCDVHQVWPVHFFNFPPF